MRLVEAGYFSNKVFERVGRIWRSPPQLGQVVSTQDLQNVHSKEQILTSLAPGERSASQISQLGRSSSIIALNRTIIDEPHGFAVLSIAWAMCCNE